MVTGGQSTTVNGLPGGSSSHLTADYHRHETISAADKIFSPQMSATANDESPLDFVSM